MFFSISCLVLFPRHLDPNAADRTINLIHTVRNYLHYHIKCAKGYLHMRMRAKTSEFIKILNRVHPVYDEEPVVSVRALGAAEQTVVARSLSVASCSQNGDLNLLGDDTINDYASLNLSPT